MARIKTLPPVVPKSTDPHYDTGAHRHWREQVVRDAGYRCEWVEDGSRCAKSAPNHRMFADHIKERQDGGALYDPANGPDGHDFCLVIDDLGHLGRVFREAEVETASFETVVMNLLEGQYADPRQVVSFNTDEGWSRDISADVAAEVRRQCDLQFCDVPSSIQDFVERHEVRSRQLSLRLL